MVIRLPISSRPEQPTGGHSNYFVGKTEKEWFTGIPHYERLRYRDVYPGIDIVYYGTEGRIEYDFADVHHFSIASGLLWGYDGGSHER